MRFVAILAVLGGILIPLGALPAGAQSSKVKATTVNVSAGSPSEFKFKLSKAKVPHGVVTFVVKNVGQVPHDFKIAGKKTKMLNPGQSVPLKVTFTKAGKFKYVCTVPTHETLGMWGNLTVT